MTGCKQSTYRVRKITLLIICLSEPHKKHPVEPGTFVLHLTQPSVSPLAMAKKRRKLDSGKPSPAVPSEVPGKGTARNDSTSLGELHSSAGPQVFMVEASSPTSKEEPLALVVEPQVPTWAEHIVHYLQTREHPEEQEEAERVALGPVCISLSMTSYTEGGPTV